MQLVKSIQEKLPLRKILTGMLIFLVLFTVMGFFAVPSILKAVLINKLSEKLHREVTIQKITFNHFIVSADINGFVVKDRGNSRTLVSPPSLRR